MLHTEEQREKPETEAFKWALLEPVPHLEGTTPVGRLQDPATVAVPVGRPIRKYASVPFLCVCERYAFKLCVGTKVCLCFIYSGPHQDLRPQGSVITCGEKLPWVIVRAKVTERSQDEFICSNSVPFFRKFSVRKLRLDSCNFLTIIC